MKRASNLAKHGLDFAAFETDFERRSAITLTTRDDLSGRHRLKLIGVFRGRLVVVAIIAPLGSEAISLVSLRRASRAERRLYDHDKP